MVQACGCCCLFKSCVLVRDFRFTYSMCMSVLPKCVCMHCMHMPNPQRLEEGCDSLELELQIVMGCHVGTLNH